MMGYYTRHELDVIGRTNYNHEELVGELSGYGDSLFEDRVKWYEHEADMRSHSAKYPELLFTLTGYGEEEGDIWREYYRGGKMQHEKVEITFLPFDESKLE